MLPTSDSYLKQATSSWFNSKSIVLSNNDSSLCSNCNLTILLEASFNSFLELKFAWKIDSITKLVDN